MPGSFVDTNILIYLVSDDTVRADEAERIMSLGGTISVQVLNEFAHVVRRKQRLSWQRTRALLALIRAALAVVPVTTATHEAGLQLADRYGLALYDALIVAAALGCGCDTLWSEDMQDGLLIRDTLRLRNPFPLPPAGSAV